MGKVQRMEDGLADIGIRVSGQRAQPGLDGVQRLADRGEAAAVDDALGNPDMFIHGASVGVHDGYGRRDISV